MADDLTQRTVTLCALIEQARSIADATDPLLAAQLSVAEVRARELRAALPDRGGSRPRDQ